MPYHLSMIAGSNAFVERESRRLTVLPGEFSLAPPAPNPFRGVTSLRFGLSQPARVELGVYDVAGRRVWSAQEAGNLSAGFHSVLWDGTRTRGAPLPSGLYFVRLVAGREVRSQRVLLLR